MAREQERSDRPANEAEADKKDKTFSDACLRYLKNRGRKPG